jgi:hypothetical protein
MPTLQSAERGAAVGRSGPAPRAGQTLLLAAVGPLVTGYVAVAAVLALVTATAPGATLSTGGVLRAAAPAWLVMYHVPVDVTGHELGMLPLLPTLLVLALVARSAGNAAGRLGWDTPRSAVRIIGAVGGAHAVFAVLLALLSLGAKVSAPPVIAFCCAGALAAVAATVGTAGPCGLLPAALSRADDVTETGLRAGRLAVVGLAAAGAVVFAVGLLGSWTTSARLFHAVAPGAGGGLGLFLLSLAYLPNVLIGATSFAVGPGFGIGTVTVSQWSFHGGPVPAVPVLAPLPVTPASWWAFVLLLPVAVGVLVGLACREMPRVGDRMRAVAVAALVAAVTWLVLAALAGGGLAGGPFDPVTVPAGSLAVAAFLLVGVPGAVTGWLSGRRDRVRVDHPAPEYDEEPDPEFEPEPDFEDEAEFDDFDEPEPEPDDE